MDIIANKYQSSIFCDLSNLKPDTKLIQTLFSKLVEWDVFPSIVKELNIQVTPNSANSIQKTPMAVDRIQFISTDRQKRVTLFGNRIDIEIFNPNSFKSYTIDQFVSDSIKLSSYILNIIEKLSNRISFITNYTNSGSANDIASFNSNITIGGETLTPFSWNQRITYKKPIIFNDKQELLNLNALFGKNVSNPQQLIQGFAAERFELILDINTPLEKNESRFGVKDISSFYYEANKLNEELKSNILTLFTK